MEVAFFSMLHAWMKDKTFQCSRSLKSKDCCPMLNDKFFFERSILLFSLGVYTSKWQSLVTLLNQSYAKILVNFVSNIHNFFFHFICGIISFLEFWDEIHPFKKSFIYCYQFHPTFIYVSIYISIHMYMKNYTYFVHTLSLMDVIVNLGFFIRRGVTTCTL